MCRHQMVTTEYVGFLSPDLASPDLLAATNNPKHFETVLFFESCSILASAAATVQTSKVLAVMLTPPTAC